MDEEDLQELRDSRNLVDTTDEMDIARGTQPGHGDDEEQKCAQCMPFLCTV